MSMMGRASVIGDSSQSQHHAISIDHDLQTSVDELSKVIKGANGMLVLFVPSSDGRLTAVAMDGLPNLVLTNHKGIGSDEKKEQAFRSWLLVATVTFTAGLTPAGGFWSADDKDKGYVAGDPVMGDRSPWRFSTFHISNTFAFFTSLMIIASLAKNRNSKKIMTIPFTCLVVLCFLSPGSTNMSVTWIRGGSPLQLAYVVIVPALNIVYMTWDLICDKSSSIIQKLHGSP